MAWVIRLVEGYGVSLGAAKRKVGEMGLLVGVFEGRELYPLNDEHYFFYASRTLACSVLL